MRFMFIIEYDYIDIYFLIKYIIKIFCMYYLICLDIYCDYYRDDNNSICFIYINV